MGMNWNTTWSSGTSAGGDIGVWIVDGTYNERDIGSSATGSSISEIIELEDREMRGLYEVYIVDPETDQLVETEEDIIIAKSEENAKLKAVSLAKLEKDVDEYDIIVHKLGSVRPKREVQEVKVIND